MPPMADKPAEPSRASLDAEESLGSNGTPYLLTNLFNFRFFMTKLANKMTTVVIANITPPIKATSLIVELRESSVSDNDSDCSLNNQAE